ncbi:MAG TPA: hypothetical protein DCM54_00750 [Gammaproteobacteria bacterium]|nr:hypothetical protein [Gammaproteobacteria bacterium]|tara:strand:+ start:2534 stop:3193 length:660 start_codon:yes stop_codon:yes gene_type:complete
MRIRCFLLTLLFSAHVVAAPDIEQFELMNALTKKEIQVELRTFEADVQSRLNEIERQNTEIITRLSQRDNDIGNYIEAISWVSGIVMGFVGILFGIGAFILYRENHDVATRTREQLDAFDQQTANLQQTFDDWFAAAKKESTRELDLLSRIMRLRILLDQENPTAEEIYPEISPLYSKPKLEYLPIFRKIMTLDLSADIKRHTQGAIDQIMAHQSNQKG